MKYSGFLSKTIWFPQTNLVLSQDTPANKQLFSVTQKIYKSFNDCFELRGFFLVISKAFVKVWQECSIFKLKQNGTFGKLLSVLSDFLKDRERRVTLNGQVPSWTGVNAGVPQGSIWDPLLFLVISTT